MRSNKYTFLSVLKYMSVLLLATLVSCSNEDNSDENGDRDPESWIMPCKIKASLPKKSYSRISYEDDNTVIKQVWQQGDEIILYNTSGENVIYKLDKINEKDPTDATFIIEGDQLSGTTFYIIYKNGSNIEVTFIDDKPIYDLSLLGQEQTNLTGNNALSHLKGYDLLVSTVSNIKQLIEFKSQGTLLTFEFNDIPNYINTPTSIVLNAYNDAEPIDVFKNNYNSSVPTSSSLTLELSGFTASNTTIKGYVLTPPFTMPAGSQLLVTLVGNDGSAGMQGEFTDSKVYDAATRYTFAIDKWASIYTAYMDQCVKNGSVPNDKEPQPINGIYEINNAWNLAWIKQHTQMSDAKKFVLNTDIIIQPKFNWIGIGLYWPPAFEGNFDGNNKTITGLYIDSTDQLQSLFGQIKNGQLENLNVKGKINIPGYIDNTGLSGLVGYIQNGTISNCVSHVDITAPNANFIGGIIGEYENSIIKNCRNEGNIVGMSQIGGISGGKNSINATSSIIGCTNNGSISGDGEQVGGIIGNSDYTTLTGNNNYGVIKSNQGQVGGIAGLAGDATISNCNNYNSVSSTSSFVGGIVGSCGNNMKLENCINKGDISTVTECVGGISGYLDGSKTINNCTNNGNINGPKYYGTLLGNSNNRETVIGTDNLNTGLLNNVNVLNSSASYIGNP